MSIHCSHCVHCSHCADAGGHSMTSPKAAIRFGLVVLAFVLTGCMEQGAIQTGADNPLTVEGLTPSVKDKHAGLVAITPGFEITKYKVIAVEKFQVTDTAVKDGEERQFADQMTGILKGQLVRRLRDSKLFDQVVNVGDGQYTANTGQPTLRLQVPSRGWAAATGPSGCGSVVAQARHARKPK